MLINSKIPELASTHLNKADGDIEGLLFFTGNLHLMVNCPSRRVEY